MVRMVEEGFALSEASNTPVMLQLRIRACHVRGSFACKDNVAPAISADAPASTRPAPFDYDRLSHPPSTFLHEKLKSERAHPRGAALHRRASPERGVCRERATIWA